MAPKASRSLKKKNDEEGFIPLELVSKILLSLPARDVARCQLHSKSVKELICSDEFRLKHTELHPQIERSLLLSSTRVLQPGTREGSLTLLYFDPMRRPQQRIKDYEIKDEIVHRVPFHGCNGLLLLRPDGHKLIHCPDGGKPTTFTVYNPTTKCARILSVHPSVEYSHVVEISILFNPLLSRHYKVVCVRAKPKRRAPFEFKFDVFRSESGSWTELGRSSEGPWLTRTSTNVSTGVGWGRGVLWRVHNGYFYLDTDSGNTRGIKFPATGNVPPTGDATKQIRLVEANGSVYHCTLIKGVRGERERESLQIWEMGANFEWLYRYGAGLYSPGEIIGVILDSNWNNCLITYSSSIIRSYNLDLGGDENGMALADLNSKLEFYASDRIRVFKFGETMAPV